MANSTDTRIKNVAPPSGHRDEDGVAFEPSGPSKAYASVMDGYKKDRSSVEPGPWKLANYRRPFEMERKDWEEHVYAQVRRVAASEEGTKDFDAFLAQALSGNAASDLMSLELVDVVERASGKSLYQWYLWDYGSGAFFPHGELEEIGGVCQHGVELEGGKEIYENLEGAYYSFEGEIRQFVEFSCEDD